METARVGKLITGTEHRDAIHVAIAPVTAGQTLRPGDHVGFAPGDVLNVFEESTSIIPVGIVDPYLKNPVQAGKRFFLFLYPGTVTSLRHKWTHPAFRDPDHIPESEQYLRMFAAQNDSTYDDILNGCFHGDDSDREIPTIFWYHFEKVTGRRIDEDERDVFVRCSC